MKFFVKPLLFLIPFFFIFSYSLSSVLSNKNISPELSFVTQSLLGKTSAKIVAASCGFTLHGSSDEFSSCTASCPGGATTPGRSQCGGACQPLTACPPTCANGAINPPACNTCSSVAQMINNQCVCFNGGTIQSGCTACPSGLTMYNNICVCANGATNPMACNVCPGGASMQSGQCVCANGATAFSGCQDCPAGNVMFNGRCAPTCQTRNVCDETFSGALVNGKCELPSGENPNASCIKEFRFTTDVVNPNGSVEFYWKVPTNVDSRCGFVDLTTPTPRPIPGLQNLSPNTDRARISNIQATTRFCLVCKFYRLGSNLTDYLGDTVVHQWIRVLRVGEN
jgi:hypothetical protein